MGYYRVDSRFCGVIMSSISDHQDIASAIIKRKADTAERPMSEHVPFKPPVF